MVQVQYFSSQYFPTVLGWSAPSLVLELCSQGMAEWSLALLYEYLGTPLYHRLPWVPTL